MYFNIQNVTGIWKLFSIMGNFMKGDVGDVLHLLQESKCKNDISIAFDNINSQHHEWAQMMVDAWAKPQTGLLTGNLMHLGNYDECLDVYYKSNSTEIAGQYCSMIIQPTNLAVIQMLINVIMGENVTNTKRYSELVYFVQGMKLSWGVCVPKSCTPEILTEYMKTLLKYYKMVNFTNVEFELKFYENLCDYKGKHPLDSKAIFAITLFSVIIITVLVCSIYDYLTRSMENRKEILIAISAYTNAKKIVSITSTHNQLCCLNGMRVISMIWIIVGHRYTIFYYAPHINGIDVSDWKHETHNMMFLAATFGVDTFFVISGLLVSFLFFQSKAEGKKINLIEYYIHRYLRLAPSLAAVVLFFATLITYIGNGPLWPIIYALFQKNCEKNWWATLLFVQNYVYPDNHCATQAWYLAVDTQLYCLAPLLLFPLLARPKKMVVVIILLTLASISAVAFQSWYYKLGSTYFDETSDFHHNYIATHIRASSWLIGLIAGYVLFKLKDKKIHLNKFVVLSLWSGALATMLVIVFGHVSFTTSGYNIWRSMIFNTMSRPCWCLALCWIIFACVHGYGGIINSFLSLPIFNVLIKINYNMYLVHVVSIVYIICRARLPTYFTNIELLHTVWADIMFTVVLAFIWTILFESPVLGLEKALIKKKQANRNFNNNSLESSYTNYNSADKTI